jgi:hypothetical protein
MKYIFTLLIVEILFGYTANKTTFINSTEIIEQDLGEIITIAEAPEEILEFLAPKEKETVFPENWYGKRKGTLVIYNNKSIAQKIPMELHVEPTDSANHCKMALIYGEGEVANIRPYDLVTLNGENGHYQTDKKNTIYLDDYYFDDVLYSRFEVMGNLLLSRIEKRNDKLYFEIVSGKLEPIATIGNDEANEVPPVNSYKITVSQRAKLIRYE